LKWIFHTIPRQGEPGHDTWKWVPGETYGGANAWSGITVDEQRGWISVRPVRRRKTFIVVSAGTNLFANSVLALDAMTGERKRHYQTVRHDIWDYDDRASAAILAL
jgi:quinoprotein glucose dehydrogenase